MIDDPLNSIKVKRGDELPHSKLNEKLVRQIRSEYQQAREEILFLQKNYSAKALAKKYGVHHCTMEKMLCGITWGHVE